MYMCVCARYMCEYKYIYIYSSYMAQRSINTHLRLAVLRWGVRIMKVATHIVTTDHTGTYKASPGFSHCRFPW